MTEQSETRLFRECSLLKYSATVLTHRKDNIRSGAKARYQGLAEACKPSANADLRNKAFVKAQKTSRKGSLEPFNHLPLTDDRQNA